MTIYEQILEHIERTEVCSAWGRGVNKYVRELIDGLDKQKEPENVYDLKRMLLNGARDWSQYSYGGCSLIYNCDIAERLCTPSELKRTSYGDRRPNASEEWLDVQARALAQAASKIISAFAAIKKMQAAANSFHHAINNYFK